MKKKTVAAQPLAADDASTSALSCDANQLHPWIPVVSVEAPFPLEVFYLVCDGMVLHPEWNSTSIIRCDLLEPETEPPVFTSYQNIRSIRRKLLPRKPSDGTLLQDCHVYKAETGKDGVLVMLPELPSRNIEHIPYYHPEVAGLAIRYISKSPYEAHDSAEPLGGTIQLDYLPLEAPAIKHIPPGMPYWSEDSRAYRTALQLISLVAKHGKARVSETSYVKRVHHDKIVPKEVFQDRYRDLREKYLWILSDWRETTDPEKHVFEDIAIATFLICLWKMLYPDNDGKPPGGFVDIGCGNGLLVYILHNEGYLGYGVDLRSRKSWSLWRSETPLRTTTLSPPELCLLQDGPAFPAGSFLIGNHADELTPWIPLLATLTPGSAFFNMPCCMHTFDDRFTLQRYSVNGDLIHSWPHVKEDMDVFQAMSSDKGGRYAAYITYIAELTIKAGWRPEREALRVPSTKNWAFIGRSRIWRNHEEQSEREREITAWIKKIANDCLTTWKPRKAEGKDH